MCHSPALKSEQYSQLEDELKFGTIYSTILPRKSRDPIGKLFTERDYLSLGWRYRALPHIYPPGKGASGGGDKESLEFFLVVLGQGTNDIYGSASFGVLP